jgi:hypothetical protein
MKKLIVALSLCAPLAAFAAPFPVTSKAARIDAAKAAGPGLTGAGYEIGLVRGIKKDGTQRFNAFPRQSEHPLSRGLGPVLPNLSGTVNRITGKVTMNPL